MYKEKYLKYKNKYFKLKYGGSTPLFEKFPECSITSEVLDNTTEVKNMTNELDEFGELIMAIEAKVRDNVPLEDFNNMYKNIVDLLKDLENIIRLYDINNIKLDEKISSINSTIELLKEYIIRSNDSVLKEKYLNTLQDLSERLGIIDDESIVIKNSSVNSRLKNLQDKIIVDSTQLKEAIEKLNKREITIKTSHDKQNEIQDNALKNNPQFTDDDAIRMRATLEERQKKELKKIHDEKQKLEAVLEDAPEYNKFQEEEYLYDLDKLYVDVITLIDITKIDNLEQKKNIMLTMIRLTKDNIILLNQLFNKIIRESEEKEKENADEDENDEDENDEDENDEDENDEESLNKKLEEALEGNPEYNKFSDLNRTLKMEFDKRRWFNNNFNSHFETINTILQDMFRKIEEQSDNFVLINQLKFIESKLGLVDKLRTDMTYAVLDSVKWTSIDSQINGGSYLVDSTESFMEVFKEEFENIKNEIDTNFLEHVVNVIGEVDSVVSWVIKDGDISGYPSVEKMVKRLSDIAIDFTDNLAILMKKHIKINKNNVFRILLNDYTERLKNNTVESSRAMNFLEIPRSRKIEFSQENLDSWDQVKTRQDRSTALTKKENEDYRKFLEISTAVQPATSAKNTLRKSQLPISPKNTSSETQPDESSIIKAQEAKRYGKGNHSVEELVYWKPVGDWELAGDAQHSYYINRPFPSDVDMNQVRAENPELIKTLNNRPPSYYG